MKPRQLIMPEMGLDDTVPMRLSLWLARPEEPIRAEQSVVEIAAGSVVVDLPSPVDGILVEQCVEEDQPVRAGQVLGHIKPREHL